MGTKRQKAKSSEGASRPTEENDLLPERWSAQRKGWAGSVGAAPRGRPQALSRHGGLPLHPTPWFPNPL